MTMPLRVPRASAIMLAFGVGAAVILRAGLAFGVGFDEEAAEVGDEGVDFVGFLFPPCGDLRVQRIGSGEFVEDHRRQEKLAER